MEGRPAIGMFTALPKNLRKKAKDVSPNNDRVQAITIDTDNDSILLINTYFPPDPKTKTYNYDADMEDMLATMDNLIDIHQCNNVVIVGDLNADYKRDNGRVARLETFLCNHDFDSAWKIYEVDYTHEFEKDDVSYTSTIDHIVWNSELSDTVLDAGVLHIVTNTSDHSPIYCDLNKVLSTEKKEQISEVKQNKISTKVLDESDWNCFYQELDHKLMLQTVPNCMDCTDVHCTNKKHILEIDKYTKEVLATVDISIQAVAATKRQNNGKARIVPGWSDLVKPICDEAKFWNAVWTSAGKPINTALHKIMKQTRNRYHFAIRKCKKATEEIKKDKLLNACLAGKGNIFDEIHKIRRVNAPTTTSIDGNDKPAERFAEVYGNLYNSVNDKKDTKVILDTLQASITMDSLEDVNLVTPDVIKDVVGEIKSNKNDPLFNFNSNCIKHAPPSLYYHIANMIRAFLIHGHVSNILLISTIVPLIKNKLGNTESSDNYRSIALSSVILKIYDWVVISLFGDRLGLDDLQFSYQKNCSTNMCTWLVVEGINHFRRNNTDVFSCFMDMKKAFDMVRHSTLFKKLIERNVPPIYLRLLLIMYISQSAKVKWNGSLSDAFSILNGVKQGAVLSAILFCIYIDGLIKEVRRNQDGCWVMDAFIGIIVYADDIALLSPSIDGLQKMIDTCSAYAKIHNLSFSTDKDPKKSKTKCIAFQQTKRDLRQINLNGELLPWVDSVKHLGTTITNTSGCCRLDQDLMEKRAAYIAKNNELIQEFYYAHSNTRIWINNIYNTSFYGAPLWNMFSRNFEKLEKSWNTSVRMMLSLPRNTHRYFIEPLSGTQHIIKSIWNRFLRFIDNIANGKKKTLKIMLDIVKLDTRSVTGNNLRHLKLKTSNCNEKDLNVYDKPYRAIPEGEAWRLSFAKELLEAKRGNITNLTKEERDDFCDYICGA